MSDPDAQAEQHRLRRTSRHLALSVVAAVLFGVAFVAIYWWVPRPGPQPDPDPTAPSPSDSVMPLQPTVLIQATTADGAIGNLLTAVAPGQPPRAVLLTLPADLVVAGPGTSPEPVRATVATLDTLRPATAVSATLGVRVDASWRMDRKALAGLVDSVGGVTVEVSERLRIRDEEDEPVLTIRPGRQRLSGMAASWYAVGTAPDEADTAQADRFADVMAKTLIRLPDSDVAIRESLTALGALAPSTIATQDLANYLRDLADALRGGSASVAVVPSTQIVVGPASLRWVDYNTATPLLREILAFALWRAGVDGPPRVLVIDPGHQPGRLGYARARIGDAGLVFVDGRGTVQGRHRRSIVNVRGPRQWGRDVASALGVPARAVRTVPPSRGPAPPSGPPWADVDASLGTAYVPGRGGG